MAKELYGSAVVTGSIAVGLSAVIGLTAIAGMVPPLYLRTVTPGCTLEILGLIGSAVGSGFTGGPPGFTVGGGWQILPGTTLLPTILNTVGNVWFVSTGATAIVNYIQHRSPDYY